MINNIKVYGINDSIRASKYPKSINISDCSEEITQTVKTLATCQKGTGHDQFLTGIVVSFDLSCSNKM
jgi:hypothetical protein